MKCNYPFTGQNCTITYLDYLKENNRYNSYLNVQYFYLIGSSITFLASLYLLCMSYKNKESYLQKVTYASCFGVSILFIIRGIDPESYGNIIPKIINQLCWDISTSLLYTVLFNYLFYMIKSFDIYNKNLSIVKKFTNIMIIITWLLCISLSFMQTYFLESRHIYRSIKLISLSFMLFILCLFILRYNYKIYKVLKRNNSTCSSNKRITKKIKIISLLLLVLSIVTITFQIYSSIVILINGYNYKLPKNGFSFPIFGLLQYLVIVFLMMTYKKRSIGKFFSKHFKCNYPKRESEIELSNITVQKTDITTIES